MISPFRDVDADDLRAVNDVEDKRLAATRLARVNLDRTIRRDNRAVILLDRLLLRLNEREVEGDARLSDRLPDQGAVLPGPDLIRRTIARLSDTRITQVTEILEVDAERASRRRRAVAVRGATYAAPETPTRTFSLLRPRGLLPMEVAGALAPSIPGSDREDSRVIPDMRKAPPKGRAFK